MKIHRNIRQGTDEWNTLRAGRVGGSSCAALLVNGKADNGLGKGAMTLVYKKAAEYIAGKEETYVNAAMERGTELEPIARRRYEDETFQTVTEVGYISDGEYIGVSPDGLVGDDGAIEIKCPGGAKFVEFADTKIIPNAYYAQMQWLLWITGRQWCDFCVFHPDFAPADLIIKRVKPDSGIHWQFSNKVPAYIAEIERVLNKVAHQKQDV